MAINILSDNTAEEDEIVKIDAELQVVAKLVQEHIDKNTRVRQSQKEYQRVYDEFVERYDALKAKRKAVYKKIANRTVTGTVASKEGISPRSFSITQNFLSKRRKW